MLAAKEFEGIELARDEPKRDGLFVVPSRIANLVQF
jgi:hypothetical protein